MSAPEIQDHGLDAWLGSAREDMTEEQRAEFGRLVRAYTQTQAGREGEPADWADRPTDQDRAAWVAAYEQATGVLDVAARGRAYREAKTAAYAGAMIASLAGQISERQAAREATITQRTLRQLLRKTPRRPLAQGREEGEPRSRHALPGVTSREE
jgi:hypothetical protein